MYIEIKNLSIKYGSIVALENINLNIEYNTFLGITGPNGGGKTSFPICVNDVVSMGDISARHFSLNFYRKKNKKEKTDKLLADFGLSHLALRHISELSGGQLQKILIARALYTDPDILILDEPTSALDSRAKTEVFQLLKILSTKKSVIMVSHESDTLANYADTIVVVDKNLSYPLVSNLPILFNKAI